MSGYSEKRKYIGQEYDAETVLSYLNARYYNGTIGRFTSEDPVFWGNQNLGDPQSLNAYSYANNNPITLSDPSGLASASSLLNSIGNLLATLKNSIGKVDSNQISAGLKIAGDALSYAVGAIINSLIFKSGRNEIENNRDRILEDYIRSSRRNGMDKEAITKKLTEIGGWKAEVVREACNKSGIG